MRRFVENERHRHTAHIHQKLLLLRGDLRQKSNESKLSGIEARCHKCRQRGIRPRERHDGEIFCKCQTHQICPGVRDDRHPGITHLCDRLSIEQLFDELRSCFFFIMFMVGYDMTCNAQMIQQDPGVTGILRRDDIRLFQCLHRSFGDILQISDRCRHQVQGAGIDFTHGMAPFYRNGRSSRFRVRG